MKKTIAILLSLILALSCCSALAEASKKPILFRGIPWGTTYSELCNQLALTFQNSTWTRFSEHFMNGEQNEEKGTKKYMAYCYFKEEERERTGNVAGYQLNDIELFFLQTLNEDGSIVTKLNQAGLCAAFYSLGDPADPNVKKTTDEKHEDLTAKLTQLYGAPDTSHKYLVWQGEGGFVSLRDDNNLYYVWGNLDDMIHALEEAERKSEEAFQADTSGL